MWIRGVTIGGWLALERSITPYLFAITSCHLVGNFCTYRSYENVSSSSSSQQPTVHNNNNNTSSSNINYCNVDECQPIVVRNPWTTGKDDDDSVFPYDEHTLREQFDTNDDDSSSRLYGQRYFERHYDTYVTKHDVDVLAAANITHVRVVIPHWMFFGLNTNTNTDTTTTNNEEDNDNDGSSSSSWYMVSSPNTMRLYLLRFVDWCRTVNVQVWIDVRYDDNDHEYRTTTSTTNCHDYWKNTNDTDDRGGRIERTLLGALRNMVLTIVEDGMNDVVTGIGIWNTAGTNNVDEPSSELSVVTKDCSPPPPMDVLQKYATRALHLIRQTLGNTTAVILTDVYNNASLWDETGFWHDEPNTFLDSHYSHVFAETTRELSPKQHIALLCTNDARDMSDCCYDPNHSTIMDPQPSVGMSRIVGQWNAAFDTLPTAKLEQVMEGIRSQQPNKNAGDVPPHVNRTVSDARKDFMLNYCKAQMVIYEAANVGVSSGWFFYNFKMQSEAFAEWDFLRGLREGWIPEIAPPNVPSEDMYGTCEDIVDKTKDDESIVEEYPKPGTPNTWKGPVIDDDYVVSHGNTMNKNDDEKGKVGEGTEESTMVAVENESESVKDEDDGSLYADDDDDTTSQDATPTEHKKRHHPFFTLFVLGFFGLAIKKVFFSPNDYRRGLGYSSVHGPPSTHGEAVTMAV